MEDRVLQKTSRRREMRQRLSSLAPTERVTRSKILIGRLTSLPHWKNAQRILLFAPLATEPDLDLLWTWKEDRTFVYPRVDGHDLVLVPVTSKDDLSLGRWALREPDALPANIVQIGSVDLALIPGLAFTRSGSRLGRGGGYYDRLLANAPPSVYKIGIAFEFQIVDALPTEGHDVDVDLVLTDAG